MNIFVRVLRILLAIAFVVLLFYITIWVLGLLGLVVPEKIITIIFVIIGLAAAVGELSGKFDNIFRSPPP